MERTRTHLREEVGGEEESVVVTVIFGDAACAGDVARNERKTQGEHIENAHLDPVIGHVRNETKNVDEERNEPPDETDAVECMARKGNAHNGPLHLTLFEEVPVHGPLVPEDFDSAKKETKDHLHQDVSPDNSESLLRNLQKG